MAFNVTALQVGRVNRSIGSGNKVLFAGRVQFQSLLITTYIQQVSFFQPATHPIRQILLLMAFEKLY